VDGINSYSELEYSNRRNPGPYHCVIFALGFTSRNTTKKKTDWEPLYILPLLLLLQTTVHKSLRAKSRDYFKEMDGWMNGIMLSIYDSFPITSLGPSLPLTSSLMT
jgi:hypothetical protein